MLFNLTFTRDIADDLGANVTTNLVKAVRTGSLGELAVDPDSLNVTKSGTCRCIYLRYCVFVFSEVTMF